MIISESKNENYVTELSNGNTTVISDVTIDKGGSGNDFSPHDLVCAGYASCLNITTRMVMQHMKLKYDKIIVNVDLDRSIEGKTTFLYDIDIISDISPTIKEKILKTVSQCPVRKTLSQEINFKPMNCKSTIDKV